MKRIITLLLTLCLCAGLYACKSPEQKQLEEAHRAAEAAEDAADAAQERYELLQELLTQYEAAQEKINLLEKGSSAYNAAVAENNRLVKQIIAEFPEIEELVSVDN